MAQQTQNEHTSTDLRSLRKRDTHPTFPCRKTPTAPAARITGGSGICFVNIRITSVTNPMRTVERSTRAPSQDICSSGDRTNSGGSNSLNESFDLPGLSE